MWQLPDDEFLAAWQPLPRVIQLQERYPFPRENRIVFRDHDHTYIGRGTRPEISDRDASRLLIAV